MKWIYESQFLIHFVENLVFLILMESKFYYMKLINFKYLFNINIINVIKNYFQKYHI